MAASALDPQSQASLMDRAGEFSSPVEGNAVNRISAPEGAVNHAQAALSACSISDV